MDIEQSKNKVTSASKKLFGIEISKKAKAYSTITITFGDQAVNHHGMQKLGEFADVGFSIKDLEEAKKKFEAKGCVCEMVHLNNALADTNIESPEAKVLIIRKGLEILDPNLDGDKLFQEQVNLEWDTKALVYGKVVNKHARSNLCYADENQEPDYAVGKGRVIAFKDIPYTNIVRSHLHEYLGDKAKNLVAEGNNYFNVAECGVGFHGDSERKKVVAVRLGASIPLHYQWFINGEPVGKRVELSLDHGDMYVMSEKASGFDWYTKKKPTLRHAAGAKKFLTIMPKKSKGSAKPKSVIKNNGNGDEYEGDKILKESRKIKKI